MGPIETESDSRFPSGKWIGFFVDGRIPGKHSMELLLTFADEKIGGEGRDSVGDFAILGRYRTADGVCSWSKSYIGRHTVTYSGFNEGNGIWGTWTLTDCGLTFSGGFHIWPQRFGVGGGDRLEEEAGIPEEADVRELVPTGGRN